MTATEFSIGPSNPLTPMTKKSICLSLATLVLAGAVLGAASKPRQRLTPQRVAELTAPTDAPAAARYTVEISGFPRVTLPTAKLEATVESIREIRFPTELDPPQAPAELRVPPTAKSEKASGIFPITPTTPRAFESLNTGWQIRVTARPRGKLVELFGVADYVEAEYVRGGYGPLSGPIFTDKGEVITPNKLDLPKTQTTTTRFHLFAVPGESSEVALYRGSKIEKHTVKITAE